jgi:hypothetical protein
MINPGIIVFLINMFNRGMDKLIPAICGIALITAILSYTRKRIKKDGLGKGFYLGVLAGVEAITLVAFLYYFPIQASRIAPKLISPAAIRWALLYLLIVPFWYSTTRRNSGTRGLFSILILLTSFLLGWSYDHWVGVIFISVPILLIFFHVIDKVAQVIMPASNPEEKSERWKKTVAFLAYVLGTQYPFWVASNKASRGLDERIAGNPTNDLGKPGIVWTWPHQVVGLSRGIEFNKVDGPGTIYTDMFESPVALIDLRTQLRVSVVDAITKDGLKVPAVVFMAFAIDRDKWPKDGWSKADFSGIKYRIGGNPGLDHPQGSYPYSSTRVRAAIKTAGINTSIQDGEKPEFYWDEWVLKQIEQATREVLADRSMDELWRPNNDGPGISALDEIAEALKDLLTPRLEEIGVQLFVARIVNYDFGDDSHVARQNIKTWSTYWEQQITAAHADAEAIYREEIENAHAFSKSVLLDSIAESISVARNIDINLPRHVIAQYYVHALEEYVKKAPGTDIVESRKRLEDLKSFLLYSRTETNE